MYVCMYVYLTFRGCLLVRGFQEEVRVECVEFGCDGGLGGKDEDMVALSGQVHYHFKAMAEIERQERDKLLIFIKIETTYVPILRSLPQLTIHWGLGQVAL